MTLRLLHVSDIHFGCQNREAVAAARAFAEASPFDAVVVTGDVTQSGRRREFQAAADWMADLPGAVICTPGNHDTPYFGVIDRLFRPFARYRDFLGPFADHGLSAEGLNIQAINTSRGAQIRLNWSKGAIRAGAARRACAAFASTPDSLRVVICHHPLMEVTAGPMTGRVRGGQRGAEILALGGADLILTGHVHMPFAHALPFGDQKTYAAGACTLSLRERGSPAGFNVVEADEEMIQITAQAWTGSHFEPQRSWGFDRRKAG